jgi:hypothetical protein
MNALEFVDESNRIEGIIRGPTAAEMMEFQRFMALERVTVEEMEAFIKVYQPDARLRDQKGLNVRVGAFLPPAGGPEIRGLLEGVVAVANVIKANGGDPAAQAYFNHLTYETIHPFTDGNGRSGRMLWAWQMGKFPLGFLHHFYYQTLAYNSNAD